MVLQCDGDLTEHDDARPAVGNYDQCGGAGGSCKGAQCKDAVWPGATCPAGFKCYRVSQWWRCASSTPCSQPTNYE